MADRMPMFEEAAELAEVNAELVGVDLTDEDKIIKATKDADAIITRDAEITRRIVEGSPKCRVIVRYGVGFDTVDVDAATDNGVIVVNIPLFCLEEVSNHIIALLLACAKKLVMLNNYTKQGRWAEAKRTQAPMGSIETSGLRLI